MHKDTLQTLSNVVYVAAVDVAARRFGRIQSFQNGEESVAPRGVVWLREDDALFITLG